jgi:hypothetical protein
MWQAVKEGRGALFALAGAAALAGYGAVAALQPDANFGRVLAAYGGVFMPWSSAPALQSSNSPVRAGHRPSRKSLVNPRSRDRSAEHRHVGRRLRDQAPRRTQPRSSDRFAVLCFTVW